MPRSAATFETVRKVALTLPGVVKSGEDALKAESKLLAWIPKNRDSEPDSVVLRIGDDDRDELIAADPEVYYVTAHYQAYNSVLVRLPRLDPAVLPDLLRVSHKFVTRKLAAKPRKRR